MNLKNNHLIFLISQPRSGSTLLQKILGSHSEIYTRSEPWIMLNPLYELKSEGVYAEYNKNWEHDASQDYINNLPNGGVDNYLTRLGVFYGDLYSEYLSANDKRYFLDKTPRYYLVINELKQLYPDAKYLILIRNPLAVLSSIITTWTKDNWLALSQYKIDLIDSIDVLCEYSAVNAKEFHIIHYDDILKDSYQSIKCCCNYLGLNFEKNILDLTVNEDHKKWIYGDKGQNKDSTEILFSNDKKWIENLKEPQFFRVIYDYLTWIGKDRFEALGYDYESNYELLMNNIPFQSLENVKMETLSLFDFLNNTREQLIDNERLRKLSQERNQIITMRDNQIKQQKDIIDKRDKNIGNLKEILDKRDNKIKSLFEINNDLSSQLNDIKKSKGYRITHKIGLSHLWYKK